MTEEEPCLFFRRADPLASEPVLVAAWLIAELGAAGRVAVDELGTDTLVLRVPPHDARPDLCGQVARLLTDTRFRGWKLDTPGAEASPDAPIVP